MKFRNHAAGFTLIERLVVIPIIGILVTILLPAIQAASKADVQPGKNPVDFTLPLGPDR